MYDKFILAENRIETSWAVSRFPDGQIQFHYDKGSKPNKLECSITSSESLDLFGQILTTVNSRMEVRVNYLYGARCDKRESGSHYVCNVAAQVSRLLGYHSNRHLISVLNPHCDEILDTAVDQVVLPISELCPNKAYDLVVFPDESSRRRYTHPLDCPWVVCSKKRDQESGDIIEHVIPSISGKNVLVLDDLCDGGRTFLDIAQKRNSKSLDLAVTHGVFSNDAVGKLLGHYDHIYCTDSLSSATQYGLNHRVTLASVWATPSAS